MVSEIQTQPALSAYGDEAGRRREPGLGGCPVVTLAQAMEKARANKSLAREDGRRGRTRSSALRRIQVRLKPDKHVPYLCHTPQLCDGIVHPMIFQRKQVG